MINRFFVFRYLVTVSKNACIGDVKRALVKMLEKSEEIDEENIIMAEVSKYLQITRVDSTRSNDAIRP